MDVWPVSVLVVNYNGAGHLRACLSALARQTVPRHRYEVVVADNASSDGSADMVRDEFPWVRLVRLRRNVGFAEGNNVARRHAHGRVVVLLNNDTVPDPYWLEELLRPLEAGEATVAASKLVFAGNARMLNSAGLYLLRDGRGADAGFRDDDRGQAEAEATTFTGCGAAVAVLPGDDGDVLDRRYFVYYEDLDAGWRGQLGGSVVRYAPRSLVRHVHGAAAGDASPLFRFHVERNRAVTSLRNADPFLAVWSAAVLAAKVAQAAVRAVGSRGRSWRQAAAVGWAFVAYLARVPATLCERYVVRTGSAGASIRR